MNEENCLPSEPQRLFLVFHLSSQLAALPLGAVESIAPMAHLARPPGMPSALEGILNLAGAAVPVWRLERLLQLPEQRPGLYSALIIMNGIASCRSALLVDRVSQVLSLPESALLPIGAEASFNACAEAEISHNGKIIHVLSPNRVLLEQEREAMAGFRAMAEQRLQDWELTTQ